MTLPIVLITAFALLILGPAGIAFAGLSWAVAHIERRERRAGR